MKVNVLGFTLDLPGGITLEQFYNYLTPFNGQENPLGDQLPEGENEKRILIGARGDYYAGLIITIKNQKSFCQLVEDGPSPRIVVERLNPNRRIMDFNFFIINRTNGRGLYQHYHQSAGLDVFGNFLRVLFTNQRLSLAETATQRGDERAASRLLKGRFRLAIMATRDNYKALVRELQSVDKFEFDCLEFGPAQDPLRGMAPYLRGRKHSARFKPDTVPGVIADQIGNVLAAHAIQRGRVTGVNQAGHETVIQLVKNKVRFDVLEYDEIAELMAFELDSFVNAEIIDILLGVKDANIEVFEDQLVGVD